jgi:Na+-transporting NADH:ubiquinone oxidoreductase subunit NqrC
MKKRILIIVLALIAIVAFGSGGYVLAKNNQEVAQVKNTRVVTAAQVETNLTEAQENNTELYKQCLEKMPQNEADLESWYSSPEHQKLHEEMMANNPEMQTMHQQMMGQNSQTNVDFQAMHYVHHGIDI